MCWFNLVGFVIIGHFTRQHLVTFAWCLAPLFGLRRSHVRVSLVPPPINDSPPIGSFPFHLVRVKIEQRL